MLAVEGYGRRLQTERRLVAWQTALLMNCWMEERITVPMLLGEEIHPDEEPISVEDFETPAAFFAAVKERKAAAAARKKAVR